MFARSVIAALALSVAACSGDADGASSLPPARGEGAAPRPALPATSAAGDSSGAVASTSTATTGTTYPNQRAEIGPNTSGVLAEIAVEEGDLVEKGDVLFRLRPQDMQLQVKQAETALKSARVRLAAVKIEHDRTQRLFEQNAVDQAQWQRVQAEHEGALAGVEQAEVGVAMARKALADATVRSPLTGIVTAKLKSEGEMVTMMPPTTVVVVEDHATLELRFQLPERSLAALKVGDPVRATFDALGGAARTAKVTRIGPNVDPRTRTVEVVAELANEDRGLKSGMLANVELAGAAPAAAAAAEMTDEAR